MEDLETNSDSEDEVMNSSHFSIWQKYVVVNESLIIFQQPEGFDDVRGSSEQLGSYSDDSDEVCMTKCYPT